MAWFKLVVNRLFPYENAKVVIIFGLKVFLKGFQKKNLFVLNSWDELVKSGMKNWNSCVIILSEKKTLCPLK